MRAKTLCSAELERALAVADPMMTVAVLLSHRAGLRAQEIARLDWRMILGASGNLADAIDLPALCTKGKTGQGKLPIASDLRRAIMRWAALRRFPSHGPVICGPRLEELSPDALRKRLKAIYRKAGLEGATSHSGRRTFATQLAKDVSLADLQALMRHSRPSTTLLYVDPSADPRLVAAVEGLAS